MLRTHLGDTGAVRSGLMICVATLGMALALLAGVPLGCCARAKQGDATPIIAFDRPLLFAYGTWQDKAGTEGSVLLLTADGITPKGGGGANLMLDLSDRSDASPVVQVLIGPKNTLHNLKLMLRDADGHTGTWSFPVPASSTKAALIPADGASFASPGEVSKEGKPDLKHIVQWQMLGDWGGDGPVDMRVEAVLAVRPDAAIRRARQERAARDAAARIQAEKDRIAARERYGKRTPDSPELQAVYAAAPDVLALRIHEGKITPARYSDYRPQPGDARKDEEGKTKLYRKGEFAGILIGPHKDGLVAYEGFSGDPLLTDEADDPANYTVRSADDPAFARGVAPTGVARKSKPDNWQQPIQAGVTVRHIVYLQLPHPLMPGKTYTVALRNINTRQAEVKLTFDPTRTWTEAIHVDQVGFRPDDPVKRAYISLWMGAAGGYEFPAGLTFHLLDTTSGKSVYTGHSGTAWPADRPEVMQDAARNYNSATVTPLDFSDFKTPGRYRLEVERVGVSYPFDVGAKVWEKAFRIQMKGFYNQRSGVDVGPPYSDYKHQADFHPGINDCVPITQSAFVNMEGGGQAELAAGDTGKPVPEAWGGYHDAGDWNPRRITHMTTTTFWQLELLQLFPDYFKSLDLGIPNDAPGPDLLKECLFELALFHRLQLPDGGVRFGIETNGDPYVGEVSWKQDMHAYVYAPDADASYIYTAVAARAAEALAVYDPALAKTYRDSALRAMNWAEADRTRRRAGGKWDNLPNLNGDNGVVSDRNLAAICLYALTHDAKWHAIYLEDTPLKGNAIPAFRGNHIARDAAFTYVRLPEGLGDTQIRQNARRALLADADGSLIYQQHNAFGIASDDPGRPQFLGFYSNPHGAVSLLRAYHLTREAKYLAGAVQACLFPAGANPENLVYTTALGANPIKNGLNLDAIATGQPPPAGITPYGIVDLKRWSDNWIVWPLNYFLGKHCQPSAFDWPTTESYFDVRMMPALDEFCTDQTMGPNAYVWGYLAARQ